MTSQWQAVAGSGATPGQVTLVVGENYVTTLVAQLDAEDALHLARSLEMYALKAIRTKQDEDMVAAEVDAFQTGVQEGRNHQ